jgi:uncharacterized SAM-binding protein YcdF (DUF218 family)
MFLFLSKLLPLFIYPLGLACLLLLLALGLLWRRPRWAAAAIALALALLVAGGNPWLSGQLIKSLEWQSLPPAVLPEADAVVVLGGGIKPAAAPRPWIDVADGGDRVLHGARLYQAGKAPLLILSGGRVAWNEGGPSESGDMAQLAMALGVPRRAIAEDPTSLNTYENAVNVKAILQQRGLNRVLLVTSAMHMPRSLMIFRRLGIDAIAAPTDFLITQQSLQAHQNTWQGRLLGLVPQAEDLFPATKALKEYLGIGIYWLRGWL